MKQLFLIFILIGINSLSFCQHDFSLINSKHDELSPVLHPNGVELYFTRANDSSNVGGKKDDGDIWISKLEEGDKWSTPVNAGLALNNVFYNSVIGFTPDGKIMFLHHRYPIDSKPPKTQGISYSELREGKWSFPKPAEIKYFKNTSKHQSGSLSANGEILLLSMKSFSSRGHEDIYVCFWDGSKFSLPKNLGNIINTHGEEMTPSLAPDNRTLFFASNGHPGKGGRDLFKSYRLDSTWTNWTIPENLAEINTSGVELSFAISPDMKWSIYTSTVNSDGYGDLNFYELPQDNIFEIAQENDSSGFVWKQDNEVLQLQGDKVFKGRVVDERSLDFIDYSVFVRYRNVEDSLSIDGEQKVFSFSVPDSLNRLYVVVKSQGFMPITETILLENDITERIYRLKRLEVGATIQLDQVYFERGTAIILENSFSELDKVVEIMNENPIMEIELAGHTDNQGDSKKNLDLSQSRVEMVKEYLVSKGISSNRVKGIGYGGSRPIASNASEETRKLNRRVEFIVTKK